MRFMVLVKATADSEAGRMPSGELLTAMGAFNQKLIEAGVMQAGEGLHPTARGARISFNAGAVAVYNGPFPLSEDLVSGFWLWKTATLDEAIEWAMQAPFGAGALEVRQVFEMEDFANITDETKAQETAQRQHLAGV